MKILLLGNGGREAIIAKKLGDNAELYSIAKYKNETINQCVEKTGGKLYIGSPFDNELVRSVLVNEKIDLCFVNNDDLLANGAIDVARELNIKTFGPTKKGARIEWDKEYSLHLVEKLMPELLIQTFYIKTIEDLDKAVSNFDGTDFVVKPNGLTGGKGVKVGGEHFFSKEEGYEYAKECLTSDGVVIIQEKIEGREFTIMGFTDGDKVIPAPVTYDYPYRFDDDKGPGTGGMGCFSCKNSLLPFITEEDYKVCVSLMEKTIKAVNKDSYEFNGVINGGFFKTKKGIRFMEFNARLGDPEALNVLTAMETEFLNLVEEVASRKEISKSICAFKETNTYVVYLVSKNYALAKKVIDKDTFSLNLKPASDINFYYSSCYKEQGDVFKMAGNSRLCAIVSSGDDMKAVKEKVDAYIKENVTDPALDYRTDIASIALVSM